MTDKNDAVVVIPELNYEYKDEYYGPYYECPRCNKVEIEIRHNYCPYCGIRISWIGEKYNANLKSFPNSNKS